MPNASGGKGKKRKRVRASTLQRQIFEALERRAPRRSRKWYQYRRALLRGALREDAFTLADFAKKLQVTHTHLNFVLRGQRPSERIDRAAAMLITHVYKDRIGSRFTKHEPTSADWTFDSEDAA